MRDLTVEADSPGDYTIIDIKGKYCEGDVLSPETCTVVELPKPAAEIEWRRIHEWFVTSTRYFENKYSICFTVQETLGLLPRLSFMAHHHSMSTTECSGTRNRRGSWSRHSIILAAR